MRPAALLASIAFSVPAAALAQPMDGAADVVAPPTAAVAAMPAPEAAPAPASLPTAAPAPAPAAVPVPPQAGPGIAPPAPGLVPAPPKPPKHGGYFGMSVVTGKGTVYLNGQSAGIDDALALAAGVTGGQSPTTLGLMLRGGWGTGDVLLGAQFNWIRSSITVDGMDAGYDFRSFDLVATWWSQEMGIYGRVGLGPSQYRVYAGSSESDPVGGVELMAGFGVTLGGFGVGLDMIRQNYDASEAGFDSVTYVLAGISLDLY